jgi:hypothetical protein
MMLMRRTVGIGMMLIMIVCSIVLWWQHDAIREQQGEEIHVIGQRVNQQSFAMICMNNKQRHVDRLV